MNTIEELIYYCNEPEPAGALMLTGEWGCGKTHFIKHAFQDAVKDNAVIICVSLFGITSVDGINASIKSSWIDTYCICKGISDINKTIRNGKKLISKMDFLPDWIKGFGSTNLQAFISISNKINEKRVILVFDDLERCQVNYVDVLGVINDYSENQKFHVIVIANQDKIIEKQHEPITITAKIEHDGVNSGKSDSILINMPPRESQESVNFSEIKEKIIQRTVPYIPDFNSIIHNVLVETKYHDDEYKDFILNYEKEIVAIFAPDIEEVIQETNISRPHNIRSLKCAINDFFRVYQLLMHNKIPHIESWLFSFICYMIAYKSGELVEDTYGSLFSESKVKKIYPSFQDAFITSGVKRWVLNGVWDNETIQHEIESVVSRNKAMTPYDIIRLNRIIDVEEDVIEQGFGDLLKNSYSGNLSLDEYVLFIENCAWARKCDYSFPETIDWNKIKCGIEKRIAMISVEFPDGQLLYKMISDENQKDFTEDEWESYQIISRFAFGNGYMFLKNRSLYIDCLKTDPHSAYTIIQNKRFNTFDEEMADVTVNAFMNVGNYEKHYQADSFKHIWEMNIQSGDYERKNGVTGFTHLRDALEKQLKVYLSCKKSISASHTRRFIDAVKSIISTVSNQAQ